MHTVFLKPNRDKSLKQLHPWIYSGAIDEARLKTSPNAGDVVTIRTNDGGFLARAGWSPASQLRARVWTFHESEVVDSALIERRLRDALHLRERLGFAQRDAFRWVHGESDALPGLVVDVYRDVVVFSISAAMMEPFRDALIEAIRKLRTPRAIVERSDADVRSFEGLPPRNALAFGNFDGKIIITEHALHYEIDVLTGHKTGYYLDQAENRARVQSLANGKRVLNCFCYTGGFSLAALRGGAASVLSVDASAEALALGMRNAALNGFAAHALKWQQADVFDFLRKQRDAAAQYDLIILDPPKFAPSAGHAERAARAYKDINLWAMKLLAKDGLLMTYSCSGGIDDAFFHKIVASAAVDARVQMRIVERLFASGDHAVALNFSEGHYLKGLLLHKSS